MYKNYSKITTAICLWAVVAVIMTPGTAVFWGILFEPDINVPDPVATRIMYLFFALFCTAFEIMFWCKFFELMRVNRINDLFAADEDGFVPVSELSKEMGITEEKLLKTTTAAIRRGYLINCNYNATEKAFLLSDKIGRPTRTLQGVPDNNPFIGVHCPGCAASLKIRANAKGTCPYCGREIIAPIYEAKDDQ